MRPCLHQLGRLTLLAGPSHDFNYRLAAPARGDLFNEPWRSWLIKLIVGVSMIERIGPERYPWTDLHVNFGADPLSYVRILCHVPTIFMTSAWTIRNLGAQSALLTRVRGWRLVPQA